MARRKSDDWLPQLLATRAGETQAYDQVVRSFQHMAFAVALSRVSEPAAAEEVAQDAFVEAFMGIQSLSDPRAFPGWLRTIVERQCGRWLRARRGPLPLTKADSSAPGPEREVEAYELRDSLTDVLEKVPEHERVVILMFYLADYSQREIAEFLELPLTTVKKRLHDAKAHLRRLLLATAESSTWALRPSSRPRFGDTVAFSTACISGDISTVAAMLKQSPTLVRSLGEVEEPHMRRISAHWGWPPLHLAAHYGHLPIVQLLLERDAPLEARALNSIGNTALGAAVWGNHIDVVRHLVAAGANVDAPNHFGQSPLHRAVRRDALKIAAFLRLSGADTTLRDADGLTPSEVARSLDHLEMLDTLTTETNMTPPDEQSPSDVFRAIKSGDLPALTRLLQEHPQLVNAKDDSGSSALLISIYHGKPAITSLLLRSGAQVNAFERARPG